MSRPTAIAVVVGLLGTTASYPGGKTDSTPRVHSRTRDVKWETSDKYPRALQAVVRWKSLIGGTDEGVAPQADVLMGVLELAPGAIYPGHKHPAPELYYVMSGTAEWTVGTETFVAQEGTAIYHPPHTLHRMINRGPDVLRAAYVWWAPGGDRKVFAGPLELVEPVPPQPSQAVFGEP